MDNESFLLKKSQSLRAFEHSKQSHNQRSYIECENASKFREKLDGNFGLRSKESLVNMIEHKFISPIHGLFYSLRECFRCVCVCSMYW